MRRDENRRVAPRRRVLALLGGLLAARGSTAQTTTPASSSAPSPLAPHSSRLTQFAEVTPGRVIRFPDDEGSHPEFRTEWWYATGWLEAHGKPLGFQLTFFRTRAARDDGNPSAFAPRQIVIAHAALSDPEIGHLLHDQRVAREGFGLVGAAQGRTEVWIDDWSLEQGAGDYVARLPARDFRLELKFVRSAAPLLQGDAGYSRKGPRPESASYYYSLPQLRVTGTLARAGKETRVTGTAWLDHEWSSAPMDRNAVGWDWTGINFSDGGALMAFRMRDKAGGTLWAGGTFRASGGAPRVLGPDEARWTSLAQWRSPSTGASYPVAWRIDAGGIEVELQPLMQDQENDTRLSTGAIYWEGAVRALRGGREIGRGYLELTGYWRALKL